MEWQTLRPFVTENKKGEFFVVLETRPGEQYTYFFGFWSKDGNFAQERASNLTFVSWDVEQFG